MDELLELNEWYWIIKIIINKKIVNERIQPLETSSEVDRGKAREDECSERVSSWTSRWQTQWSGVMGSTYSSVIVESPVE